MIVLLWWVVFGTNDECPLSVWVDALVDKVDYMTR